VKYGYTSERAREEINKRITDLDINPPSPEVLRDSLDRQNRPKVSKIRKRRARTTRSLFDDNLEIS
jgi:hypothetical protein